MQTVESLTVQDILIIAKKKRKTHKANGEWRQAEVKTTNYFKMANKSKSQTPTKH